MLVTVNTDASFCPYTKAAGWAFWVVSNHGRIKASGGFKASIKNPSVAELKSIGNAVYCLWNHSGWERDISKIIINTDCLGVINWMKEMEDIGEYTETRNRVFNLLNHKSGVKHEFRHVKAHTSKSNSRRYVNDWCDRKAKAEMKRLRKEIQNK